MCSPRLAFFFSLRTCAFHSYKVPDHIRRDFKHQYNPWTESIMAQISYSYAAAALLAMDHFNEGDDAVVPGLRDRKDKDCTIYFPEPKYEDCWTDGKNSVRALFDAVKKDQEYHPCAVLGPLAESANFDLRSVLAVFDIPMLVHYIENDIFAGTTESPRTITMSLSAEGRALAMVNYLQSRGFIASWRPGKAEQEAMLAESIEKIGKEQFDLTVASFVEEEPPADEDEGAFIRKNLQQLKDNGITTIYLSSVREPYKLPQFAIYLEQLDMLHGEYFYILPPR